jgi:hypothetical protein
MAPAIEWRAPVEFVKAAYASSVGGFKEVPNGLARHAHWVLGLRWRDHIAFANRTVAPRSIFVGIHGLGGFIKHILPCLTHRFVLMIGDEDMTAPGQLDIRYQNQKSWNDTMWDSMVHDPRVAHVWVSHLDLPPSPRVSPLPVGLNPLEFENEDANSIWLEQHMPPSDIANRALRVLVCDRLHQDQGQQFQTRGRVRDMCTDSWAAVCDTKEVPLQTFVKEIKKYPFLVCTHGGGIDPSPKAWTALISGVIPIMKPGNSLPRPACGVRGSMGQ